MNDDVAQAMPRYAKLLDRCIVSTTDLVNKAIVPIANMVKDLGMGHEKTLKDYSDGLETSLRLLVAASNYQNYLRKVIVRQSVANAYLRSLCDWSSPVGTSAVWDLEVTKKCGELARARKIGRPSYGRRYNDGRYRSRGSGGRGYDGGRAKEGRGYYNDSRPFLGKRARRGRRYSQ